MESAASVGSLRSVQQLLWHSISASLRPVEQDEVKRVLGSSTIDENEGLFKEADALADMLCMLHKDTGVLLSRKQLCSNPERSMVESEILLALDKLRACANTVLFASAVAKDPDSVIPTSDAQDKAVFDFVVASSTLQGTSTGVAGVQPVTASMLRPGTGASSRPLTASTVSSCVGTSNAAGLGAGLGGMAPRSRPSTASSCGSGSTTTLTDPQQIIRCFQSKLNVFAIDEVKDALRSALKEEHASLLDDIDYLTALLSDEADLQVKAAIPPPSLHQLRHYSSKLKRLVAVEESRLQQELVVSRMFDAAQAESSKPGRLRSMISVARDHSLPAAASQSLPVLVQAPLQHRPSSAACKDLEDNSSSAAWDRTSRADRGHQTDLSSARSQQMVTAESGVAGHSTRRSNCTYVTGRRYSAGGSGISASTGQYSPMESSIVSSCMPSAHLQQQQQQQQRQECQTERWLLQADNITSCTGDSGAVLNQQACKGAVCLSHSTKLAGDVQPQQLPSGHSVSGSSRKLPGTLLDAQAATLQGGTAAILAKHQYSLALPGASRTKQGEKLTAAELPLQ